MPNSTGERLLTEALENGKAPRRWRSLSDFSGGFAVPLVPPAIRGEGVNGKGLCRYAVIGALVAVGIS